MSRATTPLIYQFSCVPLTSRCACSVSGRFVYSSQKLERAACYYLIRKSKNLCSAFHNAFALSVCSNCCVCFDCIGISLVSWTDKARFRTYLVNSYNSNMGKLQTIASVLSWICLVNTNIDFQ